MTSRGGRKDVLRIGHMELEGTRCNQRRAADWLGEPVPGLPWVVGNVRNVSLFFYIVKREKERQGRAKHRREKYPWLPD